VRHAELEDRGGAVGSPGGSDPRAADLFSLEGIVEYE